MTRRTLLSIPFAAPLAKALGVKRSILPEVAAAREFLLSLGFPRGWVPYCIQCQLMFPVYDADDRPLFVVDIPMRPLTWATDSCRYTGMMRIDLGRLGFPANGLCDRIEEAGVYSEWQHNTYEN